MKAKYSFVRSFVLQSHIIAISCPFFCGFLCDNNIGIDSYPGCKCPPQYTGVHCELLQDYHTQSQMHLGKNSDSSAAIIFVILVLGVVLVVLTVAFMYRLREQVRRRNEVVEEHHLEPGSAKSIMEEVDFDDSAELEDILL